jgi:hypothetical protein
MKPAAPNPERLDGGVDIAKGCLKRYYPSGVHDPVTEVAKGRLRA